MLRVVAALLATASHASDFFIHNGDRVVFLGDSITEQRLYTTFIEAYALTRHPDWKLTFRNVGWSAEAALKLAPIVADLDVYLLKVTGLQGGNYSVSIDGAVVGTISKSELELGWNMARIKSPMLNQAQDVLQLVFTKNSLFFNRWRNVQLDPQRQAELPKLDKQIAGLEAKINEARILKTHHFELKPVSDTGVRS